MAGFRVEIDGIASRELADHLVEHLDPPALERAGLTLRVLDTLDERPPEAGELT